MSIQVKLATESHPASPVHYIFSPECLDRFAAQAKGMPVRVNFDGEPVGKVVGSERTDDGVSLTIDLQDEIAQRIASPAFVALKDEWNDDYTERLIQLADLNGIGMTDD